MAEWEGLLEKSFQEEILWWAPSRPHGLGLSPLETGAVRLKWADVQMPRWARSAGETRCPGLIGSRCTRHSQVYRGSGIRGPWHSLSVPTAVGVRHLVK